MSDYSAIFHYYKDKDGDLGLAFHTKALGNRSLTKVWMADTKAFQGEPVENFYFTAGLCIGGKVSLAWAREIEGIVEITESEFLKLYKQKTEQGE